MVVFQFSHSLENVFMFITTNWSSELYFLISSFDCLLYDNVVITFPEIPTCNKLNSVVDSLPSKFPPCPLTT